MALRCTGAECPAQRLRNIIHFASREAMDIEGLGESVAASLVAAGLLTTPAGIYYLDAKDIAKLDRMGKKSAENLINAIENSKSAGLAIDIRIGCCAPLASDRSAPRPARCWPPTSAAWTP